MNYPQMIIFDYGHTLLYEPDWNSLRGNASLLKYAVKNERHCTAEDMASLSHTVFGEHFKQIRQLGCDLSGQIGNRFMDEYLGLEFSLTPVERETVFWDTASAGAVMPGADRMLEGINRQGIRTAVISNLLWSSEALTRRLTRLLPMNRFEFVLTSSDYCFRKPNRLLFELALRKADLPAEAVWYCGDNPNADVEGAAQAGIFPVWYDNDTDRNYKDRADKPPQCVHLHIHEWNELTDLLAALKQR